MEVFIRKIITDTSLIKTLQKQPLGPRNKQKITQKSTKSPSNTYSITQTIEYIRLLMSYSPQFPDYLLYVQHAAPV